MNMLSAKQVSPIKTHAVPMSWRNVLFWRNSLATMFVVLRPKVDSRTLSLGPRADRSQCFSMPNISSSLPLILYCDIILLNVWVRDC